ncbi:MAG: translation initiation factor IF-2 [Salibacteraceae bacterium]
MAEGAPIRLSKAAKEFNVGLPTVVEFLAKKGITIEGRPNTKIDPEAYRLLVEEFAPDRAKKLQSNELAQTKVVRETITLDQHKKKSQDTQSEQDEVLIKNVGGFEDASPESKKPKEDKQEEKKDEVEQNKPQPKAEEKPKQTEKPSGPTIEKVEPKAKKEGAEEREGGPNVIGRIDLSSVKSNRPKKKADIAQEAKEKREIEAKEKKAKEASEEAEKSAAAEKAAAEKEEKPLAPKEQEVMKAKAQKLDGPKFVGKIDLPEPKPAKKKEESEDDKRKRKRKRIAKVDTNKPSPGGRDGNRRSGPGRKGAKAAPKPELTEEQIQSQVRETLAALKNKGKSTRSKYRRERRDAVSEKMQKEIEQAQEDQKNLKVTEFVTVSELANMMNVAPTEVISMCMSIGMMVSINQRLDKETIGLLAEEFGYTLEFVSAEIEESMLLEDEDEDPDQLLERPPIVTVMGHVDHGKTSLLDYIRRENVIAGEAGGITQHIGAYSVDLENGKTITFLDTPGHEAFTAMRARGAQVTDIAIIVIAADDAVMPQTVEAINHAQAAGVPMVFAFNKIDKDGANPDKIREQLANMNILVEEWGGKFQTQEISALNGLNVNDLLDKVLLESEMLELKANPDKMAKGTIIEATLDKGRGYTTTLIVQSGSLEIGDIILAGSYHGRVKAMFNERGLPIEIAGPSHPVSLLGLNGAPNAGDPFVVMEDEREAKNIATRRMQLQREQSIRTQRRRTLEDIGEIIKLGDYQEVNLIIKGDVDGSVEALADSLLKLSTDNIAINVIHKSVGQITESDVLLATASEAIIIGFQVRPSAQARKHAENEGIEIRLYSIIYDAINDMKAAMEGMLKPTFEEKVVANIEVRETFKISKVGTIAGCYVLDGTITRNTKVRLIRDGIVQHTGTLGSLKRFKEDVKEVKAGFECGLNIDNYNDIQEGDIIEGFEEVEVARKL